MKPISHYSHKYTSVEITLHTIFLNNLFYLYFFVLINLCYQCYFLCLLRVPIPYSLCLCFLCPPLYSMCRVCVWQPCLPLWQHCLPPSSPTESEVHALSGISVSSFTPAPHQRVKHGFCFFTAASKGLKNRFHLWCSTGDGSKKYSRSGFTIILSFKFSFLSDKRH